MPSAPDDGDAKLRWGPEYSFNWLARSLAWLLPLLQDGIVFTGITRSFHIRNQCRPEAKLRPNTTCGYRDLKERL